MYGATIGKVGILTFAATTNQACCACSNLIGVDNRYLFYYLISHKEEFIRHAGGGAQPNISKEIIVNTPIPVPPIKEQSRIVCEIEKWLWVFNSIDECKRSLRVDVDSCKAKILDLAIHGKLVEQDLSEEPAIELLKCINPDYKPSDNLHYDGGLPKGWLLCTLGEVSNYGRCVSASMGEIDNNAWVLELEDIEKDSGRILHQMSKNKRGSSGIRHRFMKGQILYSKLRTYLNKVLIAPDNGFCTTEIIPITPVDGLDPQYLILVLRSPYFLNYTAQCCYGVKMPRLGANDARKAIIPIPPIAEQHRIVQKTKSLFSELEMIASLNNIQVVE